jgi:chemotaxis regulatin CheY-phosphate phosphatase CheZ
MRSGTMNTQRAQEVLYESEAALRLVDQELYDQHEVPRGRHNTPAGGSEELPGILVQAQEQILSVLLQLRESRAVLQMPTMERFQITHEKLREVSSASEVAAIDILDACDRATELVDELDSIDGAQQPDRAKAVQVRSTLRDELHVMMDALQFQDITAQQLTHASAVLMDMERRLTEVSKLLDSSFGVEQYSSLIDDSLDDSTFDPNATTLDAEGRQALADQIFTASKIPAA